MRQASRYSIGGRPTARVKRSKNAERDKAAFFANCSTVHDRAGWPCICRIAAANRAIAKPSQHTLRRALAFHQPQRFDEQDFDETREHEIAA